MPPAGSTQTRLLRCGPAGCSATAAGTRRRRTTSASSGGPWRTALTANEWRSRSAARSGTAAAPVPSTQPPSRRRPPQGAPQSSSCRDTLQISEEQKACRARAGAVDALALVLCWSNFPSVTQAGVHALWGEADGVADGVADCVSTPQTVQLGVARRLCGSRRLLLWMWTPARHILTFIYEHSPLPALSQAPAPGFEATDGIIHN